MKTLFLAVGISAIALTAAQASDLIIADAPISAGVVQGNWDGAFVGAFGGGALADIEFPFTGGIESLFGLSPQGWLLGVDAGFNYSLGNGLVLGVVADIAGADLSDTIGFGIAGPAGIQSTVDWLGSLRARAGYDAGNYLPYLTAGLAFAHNTIEGTTFVGEGEPVTTSIDATHVGWTIGAGVEFAVDDNLSIDASYRYSDYGDADYSFPGSETDVALGLTSHQLTLGLHYGF